MAKRRASCAVSFNWHDSSVSFALDDRIVLIVEAERFFRVKKKRCTSTEMEVLIFEGMRTLSLDIDDIAHWALTSWNNPWLSESQVYKLADCDYFWDEVTFLGSCRHCLIVGHHYAHAAAFFVSGFEEATVQTCDGGGDFWERVASFYGKGQTLERISSPPADVITALPYNLIANFFYRDIFCEGKMMALAAFGSYRPNHAALIHDMLPLLSSGGTGIAKSDRPEDTNNEFTVGIKRVEKLLERNIGHLFTGPGKFTSDSLDFIATFQDIFVDQRTEDIRRLVAGQSAPNLVLAGGACLNLAANTSISDRVTENLFIAPNCDDTGQSFGALCKLIVLVHGRLPRSVLPFAGMGNDEVDMEQLEPIAKLLHEGRTIFLHNGRAELGPRALGHRSIIARADQIAKKTETSERIKEREPYRPVAPITTQEAVLEHFEGPAASPYMLHSYTVKSTSRPGLCGVTHVDGTARTQTVTRKSDPFMHGLLNCYDALGGMPVLLNTSLNLKGHPISNDIDYTLEMADICHNKGINVAVVHDGLVLCD